MGRRTCPASRSCASPAELTPAHRRRAGALRGRWAKAEAEVESAFDWYEAQSVGLGAEFLRAVDAVFASICRTSVLCAVVRGRTRRALLRRFPYGVFFYERDEDREDARRVPSLLGLRVPAEQSSATELGRWADTDFRGSA